MAAMVNECHGIYLQDGILKNVAGNKKLEVSVRKKKKALLLIKEQGRKTRLPEYHYCTLSNRHLLVGAVTPFPLSTGLWDCLKIKEETRAPQKLFPQAKRQMRTGKSEAKLQVMEGHISHDRSALMRFFLCRWRGCPLGGKKGFINVCDGAMNHTTEVFPH